jgi:hypothetical protein
MSFGKIVEDGTDLLLETDHIKVLIDLAHAGKMRTFVSKRTGVNYFYEDRRAAFTGPGYSDQDVGGFDEVFPTVNPAIYPDGQYQGVNLGDHGLLWQTAWETRVEGGHVIMVKQLPQLQCSFQKTVYLDSARSLKLDYVIHNHGSEPLKNVYTSHILLQNRPDAELIFPAEVKKVFPTVVLNIPGLSEKEWVDWPPPAEARVNPPYSPDRHNLLKGFSGRLTEGRCALRYKSLGEALTIEFDPAQLPYLGFLCMQGYAPGPDDYFYHETLLALEPSNGLGDDPESCAKTNTLHEIPAGGKFEFWVRLGITEP